MIEEVKRIVFVRNSGRLDTWFIKKENGQLPSVDKLHEIRFDPAVSQDVAVSIAEEFAGRYDQEYPTKGDLR